MNAGGESAARAPLPDSALHLHVAIKFMRALFWKLIKKIVMAVRNFDRERVIKLRQK